MDKNIRFIEKARAIHGDKYDYSKVEYVKNSDKVCIICQKHGMFWMTPHNHLQKRGCPACASESREAFLSSYDRAKINEKLKNDFFIKANEKHSNKYDYSRSRYVNSRTPITIICPVHGEFMMTPRQHLTSCGCYECGKEEFSRKKKLGVNGFIERAKMVHGDKYDYSKVVYVDSFTKVTIICPEHGEFSQTPSAHIHLKEGCPRCNESHLERLTRNSLDDFGIKFISECSKDDLSWLGLQTLDFYIPDKKIAIECQGRQHFSDKAFSGKYKKRDFEYQIANDILKNEKCKNNNVELYYLVDNVSYALNSGIQIYNKENTFNNLDDIING